MKPRFYVRQEINAWQVRDRLAVRDHSDVVAIFTNRREARARVHALNNETRDDRRADQQLTVDGETI
jgi:hypothetical protein